MSAKRGRPVPSRWLSRLLIACSLTAAACGSAGDSAAAAIRAEGSPCVPGPSADAGIDAAINADRRGEALVLELTGIDELAMQAEQEGEPIIYGDPNYGGVWGDFAGGWVVAVVNCSLVDADRIAQIAGGPDALTLIQVPYSFEQVNEFRDRLGLELRELDVPSYVAVDSTVTGRIIRVTVEDRSELPDDFGAMTPPGVFTIEEGEVVGPGGE